MYLYLPEFRRIRRIASHNKKENFMGSDFSYEDMGTSGFSSAYSAEILEENPETWILELQKKPESNKPYLEIKMWVAKESRLPTQIEMLDGSGDLVKVAEQESKNIGGYWVLSKITMTDKKKNSRTVLEMTDIKVDQNLDDEIFTRRFLQRRLR
jgi:outer membrane lipoprotein-sorting protein